MIEVYPNARYTNLSSAIPELCEISRIDLCGKQQSSFTIQQSFFNKKNCSPFVDSLFNAAEILAKSTFLLMPDPKFRKKATHIAIQMKYNRFADLGNVEAVYRKKAKLHLKERIWLCFTLPKFTLIKPIYH